MLNLPTLQECCSCCSLGLRFRSEGYRCEAHQYLGYPCSHVFLTCCEGEGGGAGEEEKGGEGDGLDNLKERPALDPTAVPIRGKVVQTRTHTLHTPLHCQGVV